MANINHLSHLEPAGMLDFESILLLKIHTDFVWSSP
jgi:hypothetical protein